MSVKVKTDYDFGSRDPAFGRIVEDIKMRLLKMSGVHHKEYATVIMQGSGTNAVEAAVATSFPQRKEFEKSSKMLVACNGAYGERIVTMCEYAGIPHVIIRKEEAQIIDPEDIRQALIDSPDISHVACIHSETTVGLLNPIEFIGRAIRSVNSEVTYIVDAMSSFGAVPIDIGKSGIDYLISSANKNLQGLPGFAFVIARLSKLRQTKGNSRSLSLDLYD
jgi:2-aminoethylphosphonate-pyruvate transaminase